MIISVVLGLVYFPLLQVSGDHVGEVAAWIPDGDGEARGMAELEQETWASPAKGGISLELPSRLYRAVHGRVGVRESRGLPVHITDFASVP